MKHQLYKDLNKRILFNNIELKKNILKFFLLNNLKKKTLKNKIMYNYNLYLKSYIQIQNRCVLTNRQYSVYSLFKLSRIRIREYALQGILYGVKKASW